MAYLRAALAIGLKVMTLALVIGLGISFLQSIINLQGANVSLKVAVGDLALLTVAMGILTGLSVSLPGTVAGLAAGGGYAGHGIGMLGAGAAWAAAQFVGRAASGGSDKKGQGANGGQAVKNAIQSAENTVAGSNGNRGGSGGRSANATNGNPSNNASTRP